jgi:hypothetical protein
MRTEAARLYQEAQRHGREAAFIANVIFTSMSKPTRKLRGLVNLLAAGREVRTLQFSLDHLLIDGVLCTWDVLESHARGERQ